MNIESQEEGCESRVEAQSRYFMGIEFTLVRIKVELLFEIIPPSILQDYFRDNYPNFNYLFYVRRSF